MGQHIARTDGNTLLEQFHDTVSCNEKWRRKYPSIYDKAESISTAYSQQSYTHHTPSMKIMGQMQHEDDLVANFSNEQPQSESSDNESDARRKVRRRKTDPYDYLPGSPLPEGPSDIEIRAALHWDNMLRKEAEPAAALWNSEEAEDESLRQVDLSEAVDRPSQENGELPRQELHNGKLLQQAIPGQYCPRLCYGRCPNNCPLYSNIEPGGISKKKTMPTPLHIKEKIQEVSDDSQETPVGGRIKRRKTRPVLSSEEADEMLSKLRTTHLAAALQTEGTTRTVEEYADSGLRGIELNISDHPAFPPVGSALPVFELQETPSAWRLPTFVPEGGRT